MTFPATYRRSARVFGLCGILLTLALAGGCGRKTAPPATQDKSKPKPAKTESAPAQTNLVDEYASVFDGNPLGRKEGRDPFFPDSMRPYPKQEVHAGPPVIREPVLVLTLIISAGANSEAVINHEALKVGDEQSMKTPPDGRVVVVQCLEIGDNYVVVKVDGKTKTLPMEKKKGIN